MKRSENRSLSIDEIIIGADKGLVDDVTHNFLAIVVGGGSLVAWIVLAFFSIYYLLVQSH